MHTTREYHQTLDSFLDRPNNANANLLQDIISKSVSPLDARHRKLIVQCIWKNKSTEGIGLIKLLITCKGPLEVVCDWIDTLPNSNDVLDLMKSMIYAYTTEIALGFVLDITARLIERNQASLELLEWAITICKHSYSDMKTIAYNIVNKSKNKLDIIHCLKYIAQEKQFQPLVAQIARFNLVANPNRKFLEEFCDVSVSIESLPVVTPQLKQYYALIEPIIIERKNIPRILELFDIINRSSSDTEFQKSLIKPHFTPGLRRQLINKMRGTPVSLTKSLLRLSLDRNTVVRRNVYDQIRNAIMDMTVKQLREIYDENEYFEIVLLKCLKLPQAKFYELVNEAIALNDFKFASVLIRADIAQMPRNIIGSLTRAIFKNNLDALEPLELWSSLKLSYELPLIDCEPLFHHLADLHSNCRSLSLLKLLEKILTFWVSDPRFTDIWKSKCSEYAQAFPVGEVSFWEAHIPLSALKILNGRPVSSQTIQQIANQCTESEMLLAANGIEVDRFADVDTLIQLDSLPVLLRLMNRTLLLPMENFTIEDARVIERAAEELPRLVIPTAIAMCFHPNPSISYRMLHVVLMKAQLNEFPRGIALIRFTYSTMFFPEIWTLWKRDAKAVSNLLSAPGYSIATKEFIKACIESDPVLIRIFHRILTK